MSCKFLNLTLNKISSRNNQGFITCRTKGGSVFKKYRLIDFKRSIVEKGSILRIERDPYRNVFIALVCYNNGVLSYILLTEGLSINSDVENFNNFIQYNSLKVGSSIQLKYLPVGSIINNIELYPFLGSQMVRAAGTFAQVIKKFNDR